MPSFGMTYIVFEFCQERLEDHVHNLDDETREEKEEPLKIRLVMQK